MAHELTNGVVFLHVPKTGGSWVEAALADQNLLRRRFAGTRHIDMHRVLYHDEMYSVRRTIVGRVRRRLGLSRNRRLSRAFRFCFVRHPLAWYESYWRYMVARGWNDWGNIDHLDDWHPLMSLNGLGDDDFNRYVAGILRRFPGFVTEMYGWYTQAGISFVGRQESLVDDLVRVLRMTGTPFDEARLRNYERRNESPTAVPRPTWDPALRAELLDVERAGIVRYGYDDARDGVGSASRRDGVCDDLALRTRS